MIKQRMPFWLYALEELRCDLHRLPRRRSSSRRDGVPQGAPGAVRGRSSTGCFRFPLSPAPGCATTTASAASCSSPTCTSTTCCSWTDNRLTSTGTGVAEVVLELLRARSRTLYWRGIDRPKVAHWLAAYELVSTLRRAAPGVDVGQGPDALPLDGAAARSSTDAVLPDEFPLSMFYEALHRKIGDVIESTKGITRVSAVPAAAAVVVVTGRRRDRRASAVVHAGWSPAGAGVVGVDAHRPGWTQVVARRSLGADEPRAASPARSSTSDEPTARAATRAARAESRARPRRRRRPPGRRLARRHGVRRQHGPAGLGRPAATCWSAPCRHVTLAFHDDLLAQRRTAGSCWSRRPRATQPDRRRRRLRRRQGGGRGLDAGAGRLLPQESGARGRCRRPRLRPSWWSRRSSHDGMRAAQAGRDVRRATPTSRDLADAVARPSGTPTRRVTSTAWRRG